MVKIPDKDSEKVFINCPYDNRYEPIFHSIIFGVLANGFSPVCAKEKTGGINRLEKILEMIEECRFSIHDISRVEYDIDTGYPRLNMAFELGLYVSCQTFGGKKHTDKDFLILDVNPNEFRHYLSDISGIDLVAHNEEPLIALSNVNLWLGQKRIEMSGNHRNYIGSKSISDFYTEFTKHFPTLCVESKADINNLAYHEYKYIASRWLKKKKQTEIMKLRDDIKIKDSLKIKKIVK
jgi:hypothetical protein